MGTGEKNYTMLAQKTFSGVRLHLKSREQKAEVSRDVVASSGKKIPPKGVSSVKEETIRNNLMGVSRYMNKKGWVDSQGRKGKGYGVYRFANKYGANVDGYSPIYSPDEWSATGDQVELGTKGLLAWAGLLLVLLGVGISLVVSTSQLGQ